MSRLACSPQLLHWSIHTKDLVRGEMTNATADEKVEKPEKRPDSPEHVCYPGFPLGHFEWGGYFFLVAPPYGGAIMGGLDGSYIY